MVYFALRGTNEPVMWLDWHSRWDFWYYVIWLPPYTHLDWHSRWRFYLMWYEWNNCTTWYNILPWLAVYHGAPVYSFVAMTTSLTKTKDKNLSRDMMNELTRLSVVKTWVNQLLSYGWFWKNKFGKIFKKTCMQIYPKRAVVSFHLSMSRPQSLAVDINFSCIG